jgi:opacity protein-like surface antigen
MSRVPILFTILALAGSGPALAQNDDFDRSGFYLGAGVAGGAFTEVEDDIEDALASLGYTTSADVEVAVGADVRAGYRFHPRIAGEIQIQSLPQAQIEIGGTDALDLETLVFTGNAKGYLLTGRFQPFVLVGGGLVHFEVEDDLGIESSEKDEGFAARFGGGVDVYLNRNFVIALDADYVLTTGDADGLDHVSFSAGLQYRF